MDKMGTALSLEQELYAALVLAVEGIDSAIAREQWSAIGDIRMIDKHTTRLNEITHSIHTTLAKAVKELTTRRIYGS